MAECFNLLETKSTTNLERPGGTSNRVDCGEVSSVEESNALRCEVTRLETVLAYYDERMTFLV